MIDRRTFFQASSALLLPSVNTPQSKLGVATTSYMTAWRRPIRTSFSNIATRSVRLEFRPH